MTLEIKDRNQSTCLPWPLFGLDDKVLSYNLAQGFYGCASSHPDGKRSALESLQPFGLAQLNGRELRS